MTDELILGEFHRTLDDRYRASLPTEFQRYVEHQTECILAKERAGCLSLWKLDVWKPRFDAEVGLVKAKLAAGKLETRTAQVQLLGRLLSTRHVTVPLAGRGRFIIPEGFRNLLAVEPGQDVVFVGAAVCVEIWSLPAWTTHQAQEIPRFRRLLNKLSE